ncbi:ras family-domain-containing protein [Dactylonectria macrodidyma]|uniref:Ras family-domain-containing protein n=1 Tax=Dactylonectria macrodidyma TaxID=307937 RepID=A0A9P9DH38_9HYPO|nr:ras family-domain-containing protein [Dactylonectria macrodidyma]
MVLWRPRVTLPSACDLQPCSQSDFEALQGRDRLNAAADQILQQDEEFAARLLSDPAYEIENRSVKFHDGESTFQSVRMSRTASFGPDGSSGSSLPTSQAPSSGSETSLSESRASSVSRRDFDIILEKSRVYTRTESNDSDMSFTSSAVRSHAWSMLSLNDISIVAVFRLPITLADIECFGPGLTFTALLKGESPQVATSQQEVAVLLMGPNSKQDNVTTSLTPPPTEANPQDTTSQTAANHAESQNTQLTAFNPKTRAPIRGGNRTPEEKAAEDPRYVDNKRVVATIKAVVVGDSNTAKNTTLISYTTGKFPTEYMPTVFGSHAVAVLIGEDPYLLELHDTTGEEDYERLRPLGYVETDVFLVFARVGSPQSYDSIEEKWVPEIQHHRPRTPFIMVGINCPNEGRDLPRSEITRVSDYKALGEAMARRVGAVKYLECDILSQLQLKDVFNEAIVAALEPPRQKRKGLRRSWRPRFLDAVKETKEEESSH